MSTKVKQIGSLFGFTVLATFLLLGISNFNRLRATPPEQVTIEEENDEVHDKLSFITPDFLMAGGSDQDNDLDSKQLNGFLTRSSIPCFHSNATESEDLAHYFHVKHAPLYILFCSLKLDATTRLS